MLLELLLLHISLLHSCRSIQTITVGRPSIDRRAPTLLQPQHILQYHRSLPTSVTVIALASVAVPAATTKCSSSIAVRAVVIMIWYSLSSQLSLTGSFTSSCDTTMMIKFNLLLQLKYLVQCLWSLPRLKLLLPQYHLNSSICSNLQCCCSSSIAVRAVVNTVNTPAVQVLLI